MRLIRSHFLFEPGFGIVMPAKPAVPQSATIQRLLGPNPVHPR